MTRRFREALDRGGHALLFFLTGLAFVLAVLQLAP